MMINGCRLAAALLLSVGLFSCGEKVIEQDFSTVSTITVGESVWMAENLNVAHFRNGDPIPQATSDSDWKKAGLEGSPAWSYYTNDDGNGEKYGKLYNWYAVHDPRGLAPEGWHVPTDEEWTALTEQLGEMAGTVMKSKDWAGGQGSNESGFNALPGGNRNHDGSFRLINNYGVWWSATSSQGNFAWFRFVTSANGYVTRDYSNKAKGLAVRLVKD